MAKEKAEPKQTRDAVNKAKDAPGVNDKGVQKPKPKREKPITDELKKNRVEFNKLVNMSKQELQEWLKTGNSRSVGMAHDGETESVGHKSGRKIVEILSKSEDELKYEDYAHMKKVVGYCHRHLKQRPDKDVKALQQTRWTKSLKNWGHDPTKSAGTSAQAESTEGDSE